MSEKGVNILLGTDGANNGNSSDLMRAMFCSAGIFKDSRRNPNLFPATQILEMATTNGAKAAQMSDQIGSLEVGKKADFVLHDRKRPEWSPLIDPVNQLVYAADGRGVHSVWINGVRVIDNYRSTLIDEEKLYCEIQQASDTLVARLDRKSTPAWPVI
ncbi:amidohydrolase family protein [Hyphomonas atlantica]|uniref:amidohydrolase family protein n=2 Tax=Hyphomonadaceae TaxID=69657 RepID=UPI003515CB06